MMTVTDLAGVTGLGWNTVKNIIKARLEKGYGHPRLKHIRRLSIDEIYFGRHKKFYTLVIDLDTGQIVWVAKGKGEKGVNPYIPSFFIHIPKAPWPEPRGTSCFVASCKRNGVRTEYFHYCACLRRSSSRGRGGKRRGWGLPLCKCCAIHANVIVVSRRGRKAALTFRGSPLRRAASCPALQPKLWSSSARIRSALARSLSWISRSRCWGLANSLTCAKSACRNNLPVGLLASLTQGIQEDLPVTVVGENGFAAVTTVDDVVDRPRILDSEFSGHRVDAILHDSSASSSGENNKYSILTPVWWETARAKAVARFACPAPYTDLQEPGGRLAKLR